MHKGLSKMNLCTVLKCKLEGLCALSKVRPEGSVSSESKCVQVLGEFFRRQDLWDFGSEIAGTRRLVR